MTEVQSFVPNGLLGLSETEQDDAFTSNGLLGGLSSTFEEISQGSTLVDSTIASTSKFSSFENGLLSDPFAGNGLLGSGSSFGEKVATTTDSQDETLPTFSQLLRESGIASTSTGVSNARIEDDFPTRPSLIRATTFDGRTVTFSRKSKTRKVFTHPNSPSLSKMLDVPIHRLKEQLSENLASELLNPELQSTSSKSHLPIEADLLVDRYRPQRYIELLGDERVHRETLEWLKQWDKCVFGRKMVPRKKFSANDDSASNYQDEHHRPREKILLLSGPPGLGKTTLAHVIACQAGYHVLEINASDSRSGQVIEDRVIPALDAGTGLGSNKPVCVIIDEIDGATGAGDNTSSFVHKIVQLTFDKSRKKKDKHDKGKRSLLRPIICICNDLYASSLAKLRPHAKIIRFTRPADIHLTRRLRHICELEGLRTDSRALTTLVGLAKGDIRGCLNTLQFIRAKNQEITEQVVRTATEGMKAADASFQTILGNLFAPLSKKRAQELGIVTDEGRYVSRLCREVEGSGAMDKIAQGCFEHYTTLKHFETSFSRFGKAAEWLVTYDIVSAMMRSEHEYALMPYLSYTIVPFYHLFQERGGARVERPKADWENYMQTKTNVEIYSSLSRCIRSNNYRAAGLRHLVANETLQLEFAPMLNRMISPPLRPVNSQIIKPAEKAILDRLVNLMVALEIRFVQDKTEDGQLVYRLDPPIDVFVTYDGKRAADIAIPRYATRHLVAMEIEAKLIANQAEAVAIQQTKPKSNFFSSNTAQEYINEEDKMDDLEIGGTEGKMLPKTATSAQPLASKKRKADQSADHAEKIPVDFFGRPITASQTMSNGSMKRTKTQQVSKYKVSYRYNEGNSAAVRRPVKLSSFL